VCASSLPNHRENAKILGVNHYSDETSSSAWLLPLTTAIFLFAVAAHAQIEHKGPAANIALAASLTPYDVVSVKQVPLNTSGGDIYSSTQIGTHDFAVSNVPLKQVIELAYDVKGDQIIGFTGPVSSARFDIEAKIVAADGGVPPKLSGQQIAAMIIPLLADRFHLAAHIESKMLPVYELVVARGGTKFQLSQTEAPGGGGWGKGGTFRSLNLKGGSMADLAAMLPDQVHRNVIDKTGLVGRADITLKWSDDVAAQQGSSDVVSIFTAVEEQLGLKLMPSKGPVDTLVIDHIEMPSPN
jgi:uncharacterized protein (TIGR03435 family)